MADRTDLFVCARRLLLPTGDVQTRGGPGMMRTTLQTLLLVQRFQQELRSIDHDFRQINAVGHACNLVETIQQIPLRRIEQV